MNRLLALTALVPLLLASHHATAQSITGAAAPTAAFPNDGADASAKQEAKTRFEHAIKLYEDGDYTLALAEFERVYELVPDYRVLYNIGQVNIQLGHYARALLTLREYLERGGATLPAERASSVRADLESLARRTASISVETQPPGAELFIDGRSFGTTPLPEPLVVDVGERRLELKLPGHQPQARTLSLAGGDSRQARFELQPEEQAAPRPSVAPPPRPVLAPQPLPPPAADNRSPWTLIGYGSAGALAAGALVAGALGASSAGQLKDLRDTPGASRAELDQAQTRTKTRFLVAEVLGAAALATGAVTLYVQLSGTRDRATARTASGVWLGLAPNGVTLGIGPSAAQ